MKSVPLSRLGKQIAEAAAALNAIGARYALIGGLALASHKVIRATQDVVQGLVNDPRRTQDLEDIRALLRANRATLDMEELREYFRLFNREPLLDELLREIP